MQVGHILVILSEQVPVGRSSERRGEGPFLDGPRGILEDIANVHFEKHARSGDRIIACLCRIHLLGDHRAGFFSFSFFFLPFILWFCDSITLDYSIGQWWISLEDSAWAKFKVRSLGGRSFHRRSETCLTYIRGQDYSSGHSCTSHGVLCLFYSGVLLVLLRP